MTEQRFRELTTDLSRRVVARLGVVGAEGIVFDERGRLFVSDTFADRILLLAPDGGPRPWTRGLRSPNGHKVLADGTHVVLEMGEPGQAGAVARLDPRGRPLSRATVDERGRPLRAPNDVTIDWHHGGCYFTDPGEFMAGQPGRLHHVDTQQGLGLGPRTAVDDGLLGFPNGLVVRPDEPVLLVAESTRNRIVQLELLGPGRVGAPHPFATLPPGRNDWTGGEAWPDGMALDLDGNVYVAHFGTGLVHVLDRTGRLLVSLDTGCDAVTNVAFGGPGMNELSVSGVTGTSLEDVHEAMVVRFTLAGVRGLPMIPCEA